MKQWFIIIASTIFVVFIALQFVMEEDSQVIKVDEIPEGFISLSFIDEFQSIVSYGYFEGYIYFYSVDEMTIDSKYLDDKSFIVMDHKKEIFVNKEKADNIIEKARLIAEARARVYKIGEEIMLEGSHAHQIPIVIEKIEYLSEQSEFGTDITDKEKILIVQIIIDDSLIPSPSPEIIRYFSHIKATNEEEYSNFIRIDDTHVGIVVPSECEVRYLYVKSPSYKNNIRKVKP